MTFWVLLGSWVAIFPGTLEPLLGVDYGSFHEAWGVSRLKFEVYTLATLGVIVLIGVIGYVLGAPTRPARRDPCRSGEREPRGCRSRAACKVAA